MRLLPRITSKLKKAVRAVNPFNFPDDEEFMERMINTHAGVRVTPDTALQFGAVYACVRVISETLAAVPLYTYSQIGEKTQIDRKDELFNLLFYRPNPWMSSYDFFRQQVTFVLLRGNAYTEIKRKRGKIQMLVPLHPARVKVKLSTAGEKIYTFTMTDGKERDIPSDSMLHFKGLSSDGLVGLGVIDDVAKQAVALGMAQEEYGSRAFGTRANIAGVLHHPKELDDDAYDRIRKSWQKAYGGLQNAHTVAITEEGMSFQQVSMTNEAAQFIEARRYQVEEICRIFRVPPHKVMDLSRAHYNNIEHTTTEFYTDTLVPWFTCIEKEIDWILIGPEELTKRYVRFDVKSLLRGDSKTRAEIEDKGLANGSLNINEVRKDNGRNPIGPEGDVHRIALNMGGAKEDDPSVANNGEPAASEKKKPTAAERDAYRLKFAFFRSFEDIIGRVLRREMADLRTYHKKNEPKSDEEMGPIRFHWRQKYSDLAHESLRNMVFAWVESIVYYQSDEERSALHGMTAALSEKLSREMAEKYAVGNLHLLRCGRSDDWQEVAEAWERTVPRNLSEQFVDEIYLSTIAEIRKASVKSAQTEVH